MLELTAVFESWHIGDGNYPPFHKGMAVNLSFMVEPLMISPARDSQDLAFAHQGDAEYDFCGDILRLYPGSAAPKTIFGIKLPVHKKYVRPALAIIDTGGFRFFIESDKVNKFKQGKRIRGKGTLLLDYFIWVEFLDRRVDPPDIFYSLEVTRIRKVQIPERFIYRHARGKSVPTRVPSADFEYVEEIDTMEGQEFDEEFYLVDFKESARKDIRKTFV